METESESVRTVCCLSCFLLPGIVLQICGFFSPYWVNFNSKNITSECFKGVVSNSECPEYVSGLGPTIEGLQATSFCITFLTSIFFLFFICCKRRTDGDINLGDVWYFICVYPFAGILGFSGCIVVIVEYGDYDKGWALYVSLVASCFLMLQIILCCCAKCMNSAQGGKNTEECGGQEMTQCTDKSSTNLAFTNQNENSGGVTGYSGPLSLGSPNNGNGMIEYSAAQIQAFGGTAGYVKQEIRIQVHQQVHQVQRAIIRQYEN